MGFHKNVLGFHPSIAVYGQTEKRDFPLILIIGREPNNDIPLRYEVNKYDFDYSPEERKCAFWNMSFKLIGEQNNLNVREIKQKFIDNNSSFIIFSDSSPQTQKNNKNNKIKIRRNIPEEKIKEHIKKILSEDIIKRVELVLLSGIDEKRGLERNLKCLKEYCTKLGIHYEEIPFLYGSNYKKMKLSDKSKNIIKRISSAWDNDFLKRLAVLHLIFR